MMLSQSGENEPADGLCAVVERIGAGIRARSFLDIGAAQGVTIDRVRFDRKVAVDPYFLFDIVAAGTDPTVTFYEMSSDQYFSEAPRETFDLILLDGPRTFDQALRDFLNALTRLNHGGVILVEDVLPPSYATALGDEHRSAMFEGTRAPTGHRWMGEVYRLVFFIHDYLADWQFATIAGDGGPMVVWRAPRSLPTGPRAVENIARLSFADFVLSRELFNIRPLADIVEYLGHREHR